jgi:subtilisin family serine protease
MRKGIFTAVFLLFSIFTNLCFGQKISSSVATQINAQNEANQALIPVFILLKHQADISGSAALATKSEKGQFVWAALNKAALKQADLRAYLQNKQFFFQPLIVVNAIFAELSPLEIYALAEREDVAKILPNLPIQAAFPLRQPHENNTNLQTRAADDTLTWGIERLQAHRLWQKNIRGQNVVIGGQDTGYDWLHPALNANYRGQNISTADHNYNWHDAIHRQHPLNDDAFNPCGFDVNQPCDDGSHGTHTMGTMAGKTDNSGQHIGLAPQAKWIGCRNMERGWGSPQSYIECFEWFLAPTDLQNNNPNPEQAPHVINNSWGCPTIEGCTVENFEIMRLAVANLRAAGVVVVVSAGNAGPDCNTIDAPAAIFGESFTIGATDINDTTIYFSSRGLVEVDGSKRPKPNVVAPGVGVRSSFPNNTYGFASGTSMAGPHVAGVVALLISADPTLAGQVERIEELLEKTADPIFSAQICNGILPTALPNPISGYGRVNTWAALSIIRPDLTHENPQNVENLRLYPNPTADFLAVITPFDATENTAVRIFNPLGQLVFEQQASFTRILQLDLSALPKGAYYISIAEPNTRRVLTRAFYKL